jgi:hypothetical protein
MNIVRTVSIGKCCVHFCYINTTVRNGRMALHAALPGVVAMVVMTFNTADPFMDTTRSPVITGSRCMKSIWRMALDTNSLPWIV